MGPMLKTWFDSLPQAEVDCFNPEFETADLFLPWEGDQELQESDLIKAIYSADAKAQTTTGSILTERNVPSAAPYMFKKPEALYTRFQESCDASGDVSDSSSAYSENLAVLDGMQAHNFLYSDEPFSSGPTDNDMADESELVCTRTTSHDVRSADEVLIESNIDTINMFDESKASDVDTRPKVIRLQRSNTGRVEKRRQSRTEKVTFKQLAAFFHLPQKEAAERLNMRSTRIKTLCRNFNIVRWPYRKLQSLNNLLKNDKKVGGKLDRATKEHVQRETAKILEDPNREVDLTVKVERQRTHRRMHQNKKRQSLTDSTGDDTTDKYNNENASPCHFGNLASPPVASQSSPRTVLPSPLGNQKYASKTKLSQYYNSAEDSYLKAVDCEVSLIDDMLIQSTECNRFARYVFHR